MPVPYTTPTTPTKAVEEYRKYFDTKLLDDALLRTYVTPEIIKESSEYIESLALSYVVMKEQIANPTPYIISNVARTYAYMITAQRKAMFARGGGNASIGGTNLTPDNDSYALKYQMYRSMLKDLLKQLTPESFTGGKVAKKRGFPFTIPLSRC